MGLAHAAGRRTDELSGGEPTASLDADAADEVVALLRRAVQERAVTLVCVVHDLDLVPRLAQRAIALRHGRAVAAQWPPGTTAHQSYFDRITRGPRYTPAHAGPRSLG